MFWLKLWSVFLSFFFFFYPLETNLIDSKDKDQVHYKRNRNQILTVHVHMELLILSSENVPFTQRVAKVILLPFDRSVNIKSSVLHSQPGKTCHKVNT